jgi:transposase
VRNYKLLASVERTFRSLNSIDLEVCPIHHRTAKRVRAHVFLCVRAYYVEWHMREAWRALMFADAEQQAKTTRDLVAPAKRSKAALAKAAPATRSMTAPRAQLLDPDD